MTTLLRCGRVEQAVRQQYGSQSLPTFTSLYDASVCAAMHHAMHCT